MLDTLTQVPNTHRVCLVLMHVFSTQVVEDTAFKQFLELVPEMRELIADFYGPPRVFFLFFITLKPSVE